jgi:2-methylisocitrate lyase-like PEP mutase family enzyme
MTVNNFGTQRPGMQPPATTRLRQMLNSGKMVAAPFVLNAYHARIAASVGFQAVYMTGFGTAAERGYPDVGLVTQTEMVDNARYIASAVDVPLICDADTGYGNPINVTRTIREYEAAGVAACHIEDQVFPKKCGFFAGKLVVPLEEHVQKIRAALAARRDPDFVIIARTDALAVNGWEDVRHRCRAYHAAGADLVFVDGIKTVEDLRTYATVLRDLPRLYNGMLLPVPAVEKMGFQVMITGGTIGVIFKALKEAFQELQDQGIVSSSRLATRDDITGVLGLAHVYELESTYGVARVQPGDDAASR